MNSTGNKITQQKAVRQRDYSFIFFIHWRRIMAQNILSALQKENIILESNIAKLFSQ